MYDFSIRWKWKNKNNNPVLKFRRTLNHKWSKSVQSLTKVFLNDIVRASGIYLKILNLISDLRSTGIINYAACKLHS